MTETPATGRSRFRLLLTTLALTPRFLAHVFHISFLAVFDREAASRKGDEYVRGWRSRGATATDPLAPLQPGTLVVVAVDGRTSWKVAEPGEDMGTIFRHWAEKSAPDAGETP